MRVMLTLMIAVVVGGLVVTARAAGERKAFEGTIRAIDDKASTLTVEGTAVTRVFQVKSDTAIVTPDKDDASLGDLKVGVRVNVAFVEAHDVLTAHRIEVTP